MNPAAPLMNYHRAIHFMQVNGLEALVACSPENVTYACGLRSPSPYVFHDMQVFGLVARDSAASHLVIPRDELAFIASTPPSTTNIRSFGETTLRWEQAKDDELAYEIGDLLKTQTRYPSAVHALASAIAECGLERSRIGIDERGILPENLAQLRTLVPDAQFVNASATWRQIRAVKTPQEIALLRRAAEINEQALEVTANSVEPGFTRLDLYRAYDRAVARHGGMLRYWDGGVGPRSAIFAQPKNDYAARLGDIVRIDGAITYDFYWADTGRTIVLGSAPDRLRRIVDALQRGVQAALELVRPGALPSEIFNAILRTVQQNGIPDYFRYHCGHGIGVEFYEIPSIRPWKEGTNEPEQVLEEGMVFNLEAPFYELGFGGAQVEITITVTENGYEYLTPQDRGLLVREF